MSTIRTIKRRIKSVSDIRQITRAMEMVSATKLKKSMNRMESSRLYIDTLESIDRHIVKYINDLRESNQSKFLQLKKEFKQYRQYPSNSSDDTLLICIGSDKGLCGSFNTNLFREARNYIRQNLTDNYKGRFCPPPGTLDVFLTTPEGKNIEYFGTVDANNVIRPRDKEVIIDKSSRTKPYKATVRFKSNEGLENISYITFNVYDDRSGASIKHLWSPSENLEFSFKGSLKLSNVLHYYNVEGKKIFILPIGKKISDAFNKLKNPRIKVLNGIEHFDQRIRFHDLQSLIKRVNTPFLNGQYGVVHILYMEFINPLKQEYRLIKLLPDPILEIFEGQVLPDGKLTETISDDDDLELDEKDDDTDEIVASELEDLELSEYIYEPSPSILIHELIPKYTEMKLFKALVNSFISEHSTRMTMMRNATENASSMIDDLVLKRNKARQAAITKELSEIVAGAEALKG